MYICPTCGLELIGENEIVKHFLKCWKEKNPNHQSKMAPRSEDIVKRENETSITNFLVAFGGDGKNG